MYRYGKWAGNPEGFPYKPQNCAYQVWETGRGARAYQCLRKGRHGPEGLYCKVHAKKVEERSHKVGGECLEKSQRTSSPD